MNIIDFYYFVAYLTQYTIPLLCDTIRANVKANLQLYVNNYSIDLFERKKY